MEKLEYKRPLSGVPTATTGADDEDSDQQDYDHLSDEVCVLIIVKIVLGTIICNTPGSGSVEHAL